MKKAYEAPTIEKIAFNYRDQVVAASGDPSGQNISGGNKWGWTAYPGSNGCRFNVWENYSVSVCNYL